MINLQLRMRLNFQRRIFFSLKQDKHEFISNTGQFLKTGIYTHLRNLQRQGIEPLPL